MTDNYLSKDIKKLGFGLMRPPFTDKDGDLELMKQMVDAYLAKGFTYFDTSYVYGQGNSETNMRKAIVERYPRDAFQLATKLPMWAVEKPEDMAAVLNKSLSRAGVDYFDFYLLHGVNASRSDRFPTSNLEKDEAYGAWDFLKGIKEEGKAKHIGFSFHDSAEVLDRILTEHPEMEFVQLQINYADWEDKTIQSKACYEVAMKHNTPVIIMESLKGGTLLKLHPDVEEIFKKANPNASAASWGIRYAASLPGIITVLSGMQSMQVVNDNISFMDEFKSLSDEEYKVIDSVREKMKDTDTIQCTACRYCVDGCPMNIRIPNIFEYINDYKIYGDIGLSLRRYGNNISDSGKASDCISCGQCESACPQHLPIINLLENAASILEK